MALLRPQTIQTPNGERLVVIPEKQYERLLEAAEDAADGRAADRAMAALESGEDELIPSEMVDRLLARESPVLVWRQYRGMTPTALAKAAKVSLKRLAAIETGSRPAGLATRNALAKALRIDLEDLD